MGRELVVQLARFGDLVQTKRLVRSLELCGSEVHLCVDRSLRTLAQLLYPHVVVHGVCAHGGGTDAGEVVLNNRAAFDALAELEFDTVYNLNFSPLNFRLASLFPPETVRGYQSFDGQDVVSPWAGMGIRWSKERRIALNLVDFWSGYAPRPCPPEAVNPAARPGGNGIGIALAGRESRRSLPVPTLREVAKTAWNILGKPHIKLLGTAMEAGAARALRKELPPEMQERTFDLTGKTDWATLIETVQGMDLLLTPDTGIMHLAAHLGVPVAAFFLSSAWCFETGPYGKGHTVFQAVQPCLPCLEHESCPYRVRCGKGFDDPMFLRFFTTRKAEHAPAGIMGLRSDLDSLGVDFVAFGGEDADTRSRFALRTFVAEHLGISGPNLDSKSSISLAQRLYHERDWVVAPKEKQTPDLLTNDEYGSQQKLKNV